MTDACSSKMLDEYVNHVQSTKVRKLDLEEALDPSSGSSIFRRAATNIGKALTSER